MSMSSETASQADGATTGGALARILATTRATVAARKAALPPAELERLAMAVPRPEPHRFARALRGPGLGCIAEFKRRSPSAGWIRQGADPAAIARAYAAAGAAALSVLTDEPFFGGSLDDLRAARAAVDLPILRKDFVVDAYQIAEARAAGADAVLLIVAALDDAGLRGLLDEARRLDLDVLVEAHSEVEVERALALGADLLGINHRDLRTFEVDTTLAVRLRDRVPRGTVLVAESGLRTPADVARMRAGGIDAILVGEGLMRQPDPGAALAALLGGLP